MATVTLRDGTIITLAPLTQLTVASTFGRETRQVRLTGEAYFTVRTSAGVPFVVKTGAVSTTVLGTAFSVRRYAADDTVRVIVDAGKVVAAGHGIPVAVSAGRMARVTDSTATSTVASDLHTYTDWAHGYLVFKDAPIPEMLSTVGRWYGYQFKLADSSLATQHVSIALKVSDPTDMMLALKATLRVTMAFDGAHGGTPVITLTPRQDRLMPAGDAPSPRARRERFTPLMEVGR
jgi:ferric-dicitrate binding protein FerR (iron transport regulator)